MIAEPATLLRQWSAIAGVAALAIAGEVLIASAMRDLGDLDNHRTGPGLKGFIGPVKAVLSSGKFLIGAFCMAFNFFAMLWALSIVDLSLAAPARKRASAGARKAPVGPRPAMLKTPGSARPISGAPSDVRAATRPARPALRALPTIAPS